MQHKLFYQYSNIQYLFYTLVVLGIARCAQGLYNNKPIEYLVFLMILFTVIAFFIYKRSNKDFVFAEIVEDMYRNSHLNDVTIMY